MEIILFIIGGFILGVILPWKLLKYTFVTFVYIIVIIAIVFLVYFMNLMSSTPY